MRAFPVFPRLPRCCAAAILASAASAQGQSCTWNVSLPPPVQFWDHYFCVAAYDSAHARTLVVETNRSGTAAARTWAWDGAAWSLLNSSGPSLRVGAAGAYDTARDRLVLFGGLFPSYTLYLGDTWEWDGATWTRVATSGPPARWYGAMAYDSARNRTVLFGGLGGGSFGDTWEWDGASWTPAATTGPSPRYTNCIAFDSARSRTVIYGNGYDSPTADLWEWDGAVWAQRPSALPGNVGYWMTFDPLRTRLILGLRPNQSPGQTWEMDSATALWTLRDPGTAPRGPAVFDTARARAVVGGGEATMEYDPTGTLVPPYITQQPASHDVFFGQPLIASIQAGGSAPLSFQWRRNGQSLTDGGTISGAATGTLTINPASNGDGGVYDVLLTNGCTSLASAPASIGVVPICYPNCDNSTTPPILNVLDFGCFLNKFAAGDTYANCDGSWNPPPILNVLDFACFLNRFAAGCS